MNDHLPFSKLGQKRSGELRGFSKTRQPPQLSLEFSPMKERQSLVSSEVSLAWEMQTYYIESERASDSPNTAR